MIPSVLLLALLQGSDAERLKKLEETVRRQQEEIDRLKTPADPGVRVSADPADGLRVRTADGNMDLHVGGRLVAHARVVLDRPDASRTSPDTFLVRAARFRVDGTFYKELGFLVEADFPSSSTGPTPTLQSAFVEWRRFQELRFMFGQLKAPMSQERIRSSLYAEFAESPLLARFVPGYEIGAMAHGQVGAFGWQLAVTNGRSHLDNAGRSRHDDNDEKEAVARLTFSPLRGLRLGVSGSVTDVDDVPIAGATATAFDIATYELGVTFFDPGAAGAAALDGRRTRAAAELSWAVGPAALRAEYLLRNDRMVDGPLEEDVRTTAWNASLSWVATGEERNPESRIVPARPFDLEGGWGAVELAARAGSAEIGDDIEDLGVSLAGQSRRATSATFSVNWWLTRNVRVSANVIREDYHDKIDFGGGRIEDVLTGFLARFQIDF